MKIIQRIKNWLATTKKEWVYPERTAMIAADVLGYSFWIIAFLDAYLRTHKFQYLIGEAVVVIFLPIFAKNWVARAKQLDGQKTKFKKDYLQTIPTISLIGFSLGAIFEGDFHQHPGLDIFCLTLLSVLVEC